MDDVDIEIQMLEEKIIELRGDPDDVDQPLGVACQPHSAQLGASSKAMTLKDVRKLAGHFGKIYALHWGPESKKLASASQDGRMIIWNANLSAKHHIVNLKSSWVMACAYSPSGRYVAAGGLDNVCSIYEVPHEPGRQSDKPKYELSHHEGYLSCARFLADDRIFTSSGDSTCIMWDVPTGQPLTVFSDHTADVMCLAVYGSKDIFVSGSCDSTAKVWDFRSKKTVKQTFPGHESDINSLSFFPDGNAFGSASDDGSCRLFDLRAYRQVHRYWDHRIMAGGTSVDFSKSGRWLFAGYDHETDALDPRSSKEGSMLVWDTLTGAIVDRPEAHEKRVSCLQVSPDGRALVTGSWDEMLKIWTV